MTVGLDCSAISGWRFADLPRKTIDTIIATRCIESRYELLRSDRDFDIFVKHVGLRVVV